MAAARPAQAMRRDRGCIVVVDDEEALRRVIVHKLRADGHEAYEVETAGAALSLIERYRVDVVLTDIMMPDMDGITLLRRVREIDPDLPVLLMTGAPELATAVEAVRLGAREYLTKPFDFARLAAAAARAIEGHRQLVERRTILDSAVRVRRASRLPLA